MKILLACEVSKITPELFAARGHEVTTCDVYPSEGWKNHYQGDVKDILGQNWDMMIAHPPCTYLCNSGVRWLYEKEGRWQQLELACKFFNLLWSAPIPKICIENPIPHKYAKEKIGKYTQIIQPWQFGHGETKGTCLWLKNLPKLRPTNIVSGRLHLIHLEPPSPIRWMNRSRIYYGISSAMAEQWG